MICHDLLYDPFGPRASKDANPLIERETTPWIAMEFSAPTEARRIDTIVDRIEYLKVRLRVFLSLEGKRF